MCQNTTMWVNGALIKRYCVLCSKTYSTLHSCNNFPVDSQQAARGARICETSLLRESRKFLDSLRVGARYTTVNHITIDKCKHRPYFEP